MTQGKRTAPRDPNQRAKAVVDAVVEWTENEAQILTPYRPPAGSVADILITEEGRRSEREERTARP
jgi:hypothetical protein